MRQAGRVARRRHFPVHRERSSDLTRTNERTWALFFAVAVALLAAILLFSGTAWAQEECTPENPCVVEPPPGDGNGGNNGGDGSHGNGGNNGGGGNNNSGGGNSGGGGSGGRGGSD